MSAIRRPFSSGPSKATPQTLCQKCLKRDIYECKSTTQERPYTTRPSRTQQLLDPKLVPKLTSEVPNELLRKRGIADEQLAKSKEERDRKRAADEDDPSNGRRKRSISTSSYTSSSVSTISTNLSRSSSPKYHKVHGNGHSNPSRNDLSAVKLLERGINKRRRSLSSSAASHSSISSYERRRPRPQEDDRNTRRRRSSISPDIRGREVGLGSKRGTGRRRSRKRSRSESVDRSRVARNRNSITPAYRTVPNRHGARRNQNDSYVDNNRRFSNDDDDRYGSSFRDQNHGMRYESARPNAAPAPVVRKEKSLSPFSKRLKLTEAMNKGR